MAHWANRLEAEARRALTLLRSALEGAVQAGNRRQVVVTNKGGELIFQTPLTYVVVGGLAVLLIGQGVVPLLLIGLLVAYALGYRAAVVPAAPR